MDLATVRQLVRQRTLDSISALREQVGEAQPRARTTVARLLNADGSDGDTAVLRIYDEIVDTFTAGLFGFGVSADDVVAQLDGVSTPRLRVEINSPGGDVWDGITIYNALRTHSAHVTTRVDGIAASIASVIAQAGDHRQILDSGQMMIHNAWGMTVGDARDHDGMADLLRQQDEVIAGIYSSRSGRKADTFRRMMDSETWFTASTAVKEGLADEVYAPPKKAAPADEPEGEEHDDEGASAGAGQRPAAGAGDEPGIIPIERRLELLATTRH